MDLVEVVIAVIEDKLLCVSLGELDFFEQVNNNIRINFLYFIIPDLQLKISFPLRSVISGIFFSISCSHKKKSSNVLKITVKKIYKLKAVISLF